MARPYRDEGSEIKSYGVKPIPKEWQKITVKDSRKPPQKVKKTK